MIIEIAGLTLLVAVAAFYIVPLVRQGKRGWPRVTGTVRNYELRESGGQGFLRYDVRYVWNGATYERTVETRDRRRGYLLNDADGLGADMRELLVKRMRRAKTVKIEVNPGDPSDAYLVDGEIVPARKMAWILGAIFFLFFVVFAYIAFV
jgi:hypothetical protein